MIIPWKSFFERFSQSFSVLRKDFLSISTYYIFFTVITGALFSFLWGLVFSLAFKFVNFNQTSWIDSNSYINLWYFWIIWFILFITVALLKIPFFIALIKNIKDAYNWELIDKKSNLIYWFSKLWAIFNTYWLIFKYVALIPSLILIAWLMVVFFDTTIWGIIIWLAILIFIYFWIFRWLRSFLSLIYSISSDDYTDDSFKKSIELTKWNVWVLFWNIILLAIVFWIFWVIFSSLTSFLDTWTQSIFWLIQDVYINHQPLDQEKINSLVSSMTPNSSNMIISLFKNIINLIFSTTLAVFWFVFYFLLMKKFEIDKWFTNDDLIEVIEK